MLYAVVNESVSIFSLRRQKLFLKLKYSRENVCMSIREKDHLYAVGSQSHVTLVDPRAPKHTPCIASKQRGQGKRSSCIVKKPFKRKINDVAYDQHAW